MKEKVQAILLNPEGKPQDGELIKINDHKIQFGGSQGDGYCYFHQSFDCIDNLTKEEKEAIKKLD